MFGFLGLNYLIVIDVDDVFEVVKLKILDGFKYWKINYIIIYEEIIMY